ncbi:MAG TPA: hypothetical protein VKS25_10005 [Solirubrobacteraceae bacterium]|nr:hypothetical protein [Solirubrobacteraceae bacterium]
MPKRLIATLALLAAILVGILAAATGQAVPAARADTGSTGSTGPTGPTGPPPPPPPSCGPVCWATASPQVNADCSAANPCALQTAIDDAQSGDTIEVLVGSYSGPVSDGGMALKFVGSGGQPEIFGTGASVVSLQTAGSSLEHIYVDNADPAGTGTALSLSGGATADRVIATAAGQACTFGGGVTFTDSVCSSTQPGVAVLQTTGSNTLRNDDIWGAGEQYGVEGTSGGGVNGSDTVINTIISSGGGDDLYASGSFGTTMTITASYSNFATMANAPGGTIVTDPTDQQKPPALVNPANGQFEEQQTSPTIGAGSDSPSNGSFDLDGNSRETTTAWQFSYGLTTAVGTATPMSPQSFSTTDIGAEQSQAAPSATTTGALAITEDSATLSGTVMPGGSASSFAHSVQAGASGLIEGDTYYFELVASNPNGSYTSGQGSFTTGTAATGGVGSNGPGGGGGGFAGGGFGFTGFPGSGNNGGTNPGSSGPTAGIASVSETSVRASGNIASLTIACNGPTSCSGKLQIDAVLLTNKTVHGKLVQVHKVIVLATGTYSVAANSRAKAKLHLKPLSLSLFKTHAKLPGFLEITPTNGNVGEQNLTLTAPLKHTRAKPKPKQKK